MTRARRLTIHGAWMMLYAALGGPAAAQDDPARPAPAPAAAVVPAQAPATASPAPQPSDAPAPAASPAEGAPAAGGTPEAAEPPNARVDAAVVSREAERPAVSQSGAAQSRFFSSPHAVLGQAYDAHRHIGLSVRISAGLALANAERELTRGSAQTSGWGATLTLDVGTTVMENLIIFGRASGFGVDHGSSDDSRNAGGAYFGLIGAGARYHFMPLDWYVLGALGLAGTTTVTDVGKAHAAGPGFGFELETGKNWWAGGYRDRWTIGLGLRFGYVRSGAVEMRRERSREPWVGSAFSLVFSTAYN